MSFIRFTHDLNISDSFITLGRTKVLNLSKGFIQQNSLDPNKDKFVVLFYDPQNNAIGIKITTNRAKDSLTLTYDRRKENNNVIQGAQIAAGNFLNAFKLDVEQYSGRYKYKILNDDKNGTLYVISLNKNGNKTN